MLGLYIHIPFCAAICNYCNFNRGLFDADLKTRYVRGLVADIAAAGLAERSPRGARPADSIYFGGGTPSLLEPEEVATLVDACCRAFLVSADAEVTIEANPDSVTVERLSGYRRAGVNRISFGVQSLRDDELQRLSRLHGAARARAAYGEARRAGFDNISVDLMMWLPQQRVSDWLESVEGVVALDPEHISLYMLEVYPNSPLRDEMARSSWSQAPDDDVATMYEAGIARLEAAGYQQYEISNVAKTGRWSRHNRKYWADGEWLGFGCGAHSTVRGVRSRNVPAPDDYLTRICQGESPVAEARTLTADERLGDALFTGLRLTEGVDVHVINRRYSTDVWQRFGSDLQPFLDQGLLEVSPSRWRLTKSGRLLAHEVMSVFV